MRARAAELAAAFDDRGLQPELAGADGAIVAARTAPDDHDVVLCHMRLSSDSRAPYRRAMRNQSAADVVAPSARCLLVPIAAIAVIDDEDQKPDKEQRREERDLRCGGSRIVRQRSGLKLSTVRLCTDCTMLPAPPCHQRPTRAVACEAEQPHP